MNTASMSVNIKNQTSIWFVILLALQLLIFCTEHVVHSLSSVGLEGFSGAREVPRTSTRAVEENTQAPTVRTFDLGQDKLVDIFVPDDNVNRQASSQGGQGTTISTFDGRGDVIWPSSVALARLVAHCPALVEDRNVLELGCGLGLVAAAVCKHAKPGHVAVTDRDRSVLSMAYTSCTRLQQARASVSRTTMDWSDSSTWPNQNYDVILASDVLYEKSSMLPLVNVLKKYLLHGRRSDNKLPMKRAIIVDPVKQLNRDAFAYAAYKAGLEVDTVPFPGSEDLVLMSVTPLDENA